MNPRAIYGQAAEALAAQAHRFMRAAQVLTRITSRLADCDNPARVLQALAKYQHSALPEPDFVSDVASMLEGAKSPEWREARAKQRQAALRDTLQLQLSSAEQPITVLPEWGRAVVLDMAREKSATLSAAVCAIEHGRDEDGEILYRLTNYMSGRLGVAALQGALEGAGLAPGRSNVVPLPVRGRARP